MTHNPDLTTALDILRRVHEQMPATTREQQRLKANMSCGLVYLEDAAKVADKLNEELKT